MKRMTKLSHYLVIANLVILAGLLVGLVKGVADSSDTIPVLDKMGIAMSNHDFQFSFLVLTLITNLFFAVIWFIGKRVSQN